MSPESLPGVPEPARGADEFALDRPRLTELLLAESERFFDRNPAFADMREPVAAAIARLAARRAVRPLTAAGGWLLEAACPQCSRHQQINFSRSVAQRFQIKFLAAWTDPVRRPPMVTQLADYLLRRHPEIQERGLDLVVNAYRVNRTRERCLVYSPKGNPT